MFLLFYRYKFSTLFEESSIFIYIYIYIYIYMYVYMYRKSKRERERLVKPSCYTWYKCQHSQLFKLNISYLKINAMFSFFEPCIRTSTLVFLKHLRSEWIPSLSAVTTRLDHEKDSGLLKSLA